MNDTQRKIITVLQCAPANTRELAEKSGASSRGLRDSIYALRALNKIHVSIPSVGRKPSVYAIGAKAKAPPAMKKPLLRPIYINGKRVCNGFEDWLDGLMREVA